MVYRNDEAEELRRAGFREAKDRGEVYCPFNKFGSGCNTFCELYVDGCALSELYGLKDAVEEVARSIDDLKNVLQSIQSMGGATKQE